MDLNSYSHELRFFPSFWTGQRWLLQAYLEVLRLLLSAFQWHMEEYRYIAVLLEIWTRSWL